MIGGAGSLPENIARTKSMPAIEAITSVGVTPYSGLGAVSDMAKVPAKYDDGHHTKREMIALACCWHGAPQRHCEKRSDEAIRGPQTPEPLDCFASLAQ